MSWAMLFPDQGSVEVQCAEEDDVASALAEAARPGEVAVIANVNAPGQVVISGHLPALARASEAVRAAGARRAMPLAVGAAFHSPLMAAAAERLGRAIEAATLREGRPQAFNVDGEVRTGTDEIRAALRAQLTSAVRWTRCVGALRARG